MGWKMDSAKAYTMAVENDGFAIYYRPPRAING